MRFAFKFSIRSWVTPSPPGPHRRMAHEVLEPRPGRHNVAHGESRGEKGELD